MRLAAEKVGEGRDGKERLASPIWNYGARGGMKGEGVGVKRWLDSSDHSQKEGAGQPQIWKTT